MSEQQQAAWLDVADAEYHQRQFAVPYRSTVAFCDWLEKLGCLDVASRQRLVDIGAGMGANVYYLASRYPQCDVIGFELNPDLVEQGNAIFEAKGIPNARLQVADLYELSAADVGNVDGIVSFQTLSWLPNFERPLEIIGSLGAQWMAFSSLFYDGAISAEIRIRDFTNPDVGGAARESFYNVYPIPHVRDLMAQHTYAHFHATPFDIDIDLPKPDEPRMATYTELLADKRRIQLSGPLWLPWHFVVGSKAALT